MDKETFRELIIEKMKSIHLDYEDFIGYSYSEDPNVWMNNLTKVLPDTYHYSLLSGDMTRAQLVMTIFAELAAAYESLDLGGSGEEPERRQLNNEIS